MTKRVVIGKKGVSAAEGAVTTTDSMMAYIKQLVSGGIARDAAIAAMLAIQSEQCCVKTDGAVLTGDDDLFVISGGPVRARIIGIVTTSIGGAANGDLQIDVTEPEATVDLNAAPVAIDSDAAGTMYMNIDSTSVFTPITNGASIIDGVAAPECYFNLPIGTVIFRSSAAQDGVIAWYMTYTKCSPLSVVTAAA